MWTWVLQALSGSVNRCGDGNVEKAAMGLGLNDRCAMCALKIRSSDDPTDHAQARC
jgi:hypothetical protein